MAKLVHTLLPLAQESQFALIGLIRLVDQNLRRLKGVPGAVQRLLRAFVCRRRLVQRRDKGPPIWPGMEMAFIVLVQGGLRGALSLIGSLGPGARSVDNGASGDVCDPSVRRRRRLEFDFAQAGSAHHRPRSRDSGRRSRSSYVREGAGLRADCRSCGRSAPALARRSDCEP